MLPVFLIVLKTSIAIIFYSSPIINFNRPIKNKNKTRIVYAFGLFFGDNNSNGCMCFSSIGIGIGNGKGYRSIGIYW